MSQREILDTIMNTLLKEKQRIVPRPTSNGTMIPDHVNPQYVVLSPVMAEKAEIKAGQLIYGCKVIVCDEFKDDDMAILESAYEMLSITRTANA